MSFCSHVDVDEHDIPERKLGQSKNCETSNNSINSNPSNRLSPLKAASSSTGAAGGSQCGSGTMRSTESSPMREGGSSTGGSPKMGTDYLAMNPAFTLHKKPLSEQLNWMNAEFQKLEATTQDSRKMDFTTSLSMMPLNRYSNIAANEETIFPPLPRSTKNPLADPSFLYINGNTMDLGQDRQFVASQAPVPPGFQHFFATLIRYRISFIIMVTKEVESDTMKAHPYWPSEDSSESKPQRCGRFSLWRDTKTTPNYCEDSGLKLVSRSFYIQELTDSESNSRRAGGKSSIMSPTASPSGTTDKSFYAGPHKVNLIQYVGWPDHGVPSSVTSFQYLLKKIEAHKESSPILVHCSAGVGRTATLIGCYAGMYRIRRGEFTDKTLAELVAQMRRARFGSIQRVEQYMFMYQTLMNFMGVDTTELSREIAKRAADFQSLMNRMRRC